MLIKEILEFEPAPKPDANRLMQKISNAFTRHGQVKGLLDLEHTGSTGLCTSPSAVSGPEHDAAVNPAEISPTPAQRLASNRYRVAAPKLPPISTSGVFTSIDLADRRHSSSHAHVRGRRKGLWMAAAHC